MDTLSAAISVNGVASSVPSLACEGCTIVREGRWLRTARIFDEPWLETPLTNPAATIDTVRTSSLGADLFTFGQMLPDVTPHYDYRLNWDSLAVAPTSDFDAWWKNLPQEFRKNARKSQKLGVEVGAVEFDDELVRGIKAIYDETPIRQGRRFWHFGKEFATVKQENSSYLPRSQFIGAFHHGELIGFLKMVYVGRSARIMQILAKNAHSEKRPMLALLSSAVQICAQRSVDHLIYGQYVYGRKRGSSMTEFKRRSGFQEILVPRYYVPFTVRGRLALTTGVHSGLLNVLPEPVIATALGARNWIAQRFSRR